MYDTLRYIQSLIGMVAFAALLYRLIYSWPRLTVLEHALTMLLLGSLLIAALASLRVASFGQTVPNEVLFPAIILRIGCLVLAVKWESWMGRRHSPFKRVAPAHRGQ